MIKKIIARNFKGSVFSQELSWFNIFIGPNGSGKSTRTMALELAVNGCLSDIKQNGLIFDAYSGGGKASMYVGFESDNGSEIGRKYFKNGETVSCNLLVNNQKYSKEDFTRAIINSGDPAVFDMEGFFSLTDSKKIEYLFSMYSKDDGNKFREIVGKIEDIKSSLQKARRSVKISQGIIERSRESLIADNYDPDDPNFLEKIASEKKRLKETISALELKDAEKKHERIVAERVEKSADDPEKVTNSESIHKADKPVGDIACSCGKCDKNGFKEKMGIILSVMEKTGCRHCAAMIVAKKMLREE